MQHPNYQSINQSINRSESDEDDAASVCSGGIELDPLLMERELFHSEDADSLLVNWKTKYYCQLRSCKDCYHAISVRLSCQYFVNNIDLCIFLNQKKCCLATAVLSMFIVFSVLGVYLILHPPNSSAFAPVRYYDYIIVGSGPAGSIVVSDLTIHIIV